MLLIEIFVLFYKDSRSTSSHSETIIQTFTLMIHLIESIRNSFQQTLERQLQALQPQTSSQRIIVKVPVSRRQKKRLTNKKPKQNRK